MKTALISVYNKAGITNFAQELINLGWNIIASGGTAKTLEQANIKVTDAADFVGGEAILGHRVVTLSREIHAALLSQDTPEDNAELKKLNIPKIDLVCVDLYPLEDEINNPSATCETVIDKTDIGGPTLIRSAAKGERIVVCDAADRGATIEWLKNGEKNKDKFISQMRAKAEGTVAKYCLESAKYHGEYNGAIGELNAPCKYGENPAQAPAGFYSTKKNDPLGLDQFKIIDENNQNQTLSCSYNTLCDIDRLLQTITHIAAGIDINKIKLSHIAIAAKHGNACGAAISDEPIDTIEKMVSGDTRAIFGGVVMLNFHLDKEGAEILLTYLADGGKRFLEVVVAPSFDEGAIKILKGKKGRCKIIVNPALKNLDKDSLDTQDRLRYVRGGFLMQPNYNYILDLIYSFDIKFLHKNLNFFLLLNLLHNSNGAYICIPDDLLESRSLYFLNFYLTDNTDSILNVKNYISIGEKSNINMFEGHFNLSHNSFININTNLHLKSKSVVNYSVVNDSVLSFLNL